MRWYFGFFFLSGFCSILYELVWLRLAMAEFAVTTALVSIVLSAFMVGLGCGSWGAGRYVRRRQFHSPPSSLRLYALAELLIGASAFVVPWALGRGRIFLESAEAHYLLSVPMYYALAGLWIGLTLIPWCACMGATFPLVMAAIRDSFPGVSERSFSYLYVANLLGAMTGTAVPLLLIEKLGFHGTLHVGAGLNLCLATAAFLVAIKLEPKLAAFGERTKAPTPLRAIPAGSYYLLFGTGFASMASEVVWIRLFTPGLSTVVYAFAAILGLYLGATYVGSLLYRRSAAQGTMLPSSLLFSLLGLSILFPLLICDPRLPIVYPLRVGSIIPFSLLVGWITPMILDGVAQGDPDRAGRGYAINVAGCVLGPLISGFLLLPLLGERYTLLVVALPWIVLSFAVLRVQVANQEGRHLAWWTVALLGVSSIVLVGITKDFETRYWPREVRRDSTATVTAAGASRTEKVLLVNGVGMTGLTPVTKMIAHLPLAFLARPPKDALVICFGMGTTHRSMLSWGIPSTAVELVPSVVSVFPFFHSDAAEVLRSPLSRVVVDDGRFYLERSAEQYDVIALDPPPPVEAAASSLLYSREFYSIAKKHLRTGGILQQWFPQGSADPVAVASAAKAIQQSFAYVRVFHSVEGWGYHFLASDSPIPSYSAAELASRLPTGAVTDLLEWGPAKNAPDQFARVLNQELSLDDLIRSAPDVPALRDDRPVNEYYVLRRMGSPEYFSRLWKRILVRLGR